jgi:predicted PurR-regulated permease PerM
MRTILGPVISTAGLLFLLWPYRQSSAVRRLLAIVVVLLLLWILSQARTIVYPALAALALAFLLDPAVDHMHARKIPRGVAALALMLPLLAILLFAALVVIPALAGQARTLIQQLPKAYEMIAAWLDPLLRDLTGREGVSLLPRDLSELLPAADHVLKGVTSGVIHVGRGVAAVFQVAAFVLLMPILTYYILVDFDRLRDVIRPYLSADYAENIRVLGTIFQESVGAWLKGQLLVALIIAVLATVGFLLIGLPYPFLLGCVAGVLNLIPVLGFWITFVLALSAALFASQPFPMLGKTVLVLLAIQMLEQNLLSPKIVGKQLGVKPVVLLLTMLGLSIFLGILGVFLAAPLIGVVRGAWVLWVRPQSAGADISANSD